MDESETVNVSVPLGGPLYVPNIVGTLTNVSRFEESVCQQIQNLKDELCDDSLDMWNDEISVDCLKIVSEEELVEKALEQAFEVAELVSGDREESVNGSLFDEYGDGCLRNLDKSVIGSDACQEDVVIVPSEMLPLKACGSKNLNKKSSRKRRRGDKSDNSLDESYMAKVEELARVKPKQEDDKASVRLHSFDGACKSSEGGNGTVNGSKVRYLKSTSVLTKCSNTCDVNIPVKSPETVLCIEVYHNIKKWTKTQEFLVLGRQLLTEVKDKIYCLTDAKMKRAGQYNPSGYFLVEDLFYNDMRESTSVDYSGLILDWLDNSKADALEKWKTLIKQKQEEQQLPKFQSVQMQNSRFCDMNFKLGARYIYCHQGDCKHMIVIRDIRLIHPDDVQNEAAYPLVTYKMKSRPAKCSVCKIS